MNKMKWLKIVLLLAIYIVISSTFQLNSRAKSVLVFVLLGINLLTHIYIDKKRT